MLYDGQLSSACHRVSQLCGWEQDTVTPTLITTAQTLSPNDITSTRWQ